jgi:hypothetical protein
VTVSLRRVAVPFVAAAPGGTRVRARLRLSPEDEAVLRVAGSHLGRWRGRTLPSDALRDGWTPGTGRGPGRCGSGR